MAHLISRHLRRGDELCRYKSTPMDFNTIKRVKQIHEKCDAILEKHWQATPLLVASGLGLDNIVRGFIEFSKETNTSLHTGYKDRTGNTALQEAAKKNHVKVIMLLLNAYPELLISARNYDGKTPLSLLREPKYDETVIAALEVATRPRTEVDAPPSTLLSMGNQQQDLWFLGRSSRELDSILEKRIWFSMEEAINFGQISDEKYTESTMDPSTYPKSHKSYASSRSNKLDVGELELSPNRNTVLHLVTKFGDIEYVKRILIKHPSLMYNRNSKGETPAYIAARDGHLDVVEMMINHLKTKNDDIEYLMMRTTDNETALLIAIRNHHAGVVFCLAKEVPRLANRINKFGESPLHLAAGKGYGAIVKLLLEKCKEIAFGGPNGKTSLHAAAVSGSEKCIQHLLRSDRDQLYIQDEYGWTPLAYAVHYGHIEATKALLFADLSIGYQIMGTDDTNVTAIHIAANQGNCEIMYVLIYNCPGCVEVTNSKGRNILHAAVEKEKIKVIEFIFQHESLMILINEQDCDGNTPIHLLVASDLETTEIMRDPRVDVTVLNNKNQTPVDMASSDEKRERLLQAIAVGTRPSHDLSPCDPSPVLNRSDCNKKESEVALAFVDSVALVATLIATATFAAAFTVPGGFDGNKGSKEGMPILLRKSAFQAFFVTNAIAFSCSCSVLFGYIRVQIYGTDYGDDEEEGLEDMINIIKLMYLLIGIAMLAMAIAFVTGIYVILTPSLGFAIPLSAICLFIMISMSVVPHRYLGFAGTVFDIIL